MVAMLYEGAWDSCGAGADQARELLERAGIGGGDGVDPETSELRCDLLRGAGDGDAYPMDVDGQPALENAPGAGNTCPFVDLIKHRMQRWRQGRDRIDGEINRVSWSVPRRERRVDDPKRGITPGDEHRVATSQVLVRRELRCAIARIPQHQGCRPVDTREHASPAQPTKRAQ